MSKDEDIVGIEQFIENIDNQLDKSKSLQGANFDFYSKLEKSYLMSNYVFYQEYDSFLIKNTQAYISFFTVSYSIKNGKYNIGSQEIQTIGIIKLNQNYGHIIIRPEYLIDKFSEILNPKEIDFHDYPEFSSRYYVLSSTSYTTLFLNDATIKKIESMDNVFIEIIENILFIKYLKRFNIDDSMHILQFLKTIK